jgi:hypothetical protein
VRARDDRRRIRGADPHVDTALEHRGDAILFTLTRHR